MPIEWQYADDADFVNDDLNKLTDICYRNDVFQELWDLHVNESKTEFVHIYLASRGDVDSDGTLLLIIKPGVPARVLGRFCVPHVTSNTELY